ncbi:hypothetical protein [Ensifer soli]|uniref:hypothetical protein n=1 Tax=Ciceribacter sp. sgz301302 TaxID=3342379 RepID=UPI0035B7EF09
MNDTLVLGALLAGSIVPFLARLLLSALGAEEAIALTLRGGARFAPLPLLAAVLAGPALLVAAVIGERRAGRLPAVGLLVSVAILAGWAGCYGILVLEAAAWAGIVTVPPG